MVRKQWPNLIAFGMSASLLMLFVMGQLTMAFVGVDTYRKIDDRVTKTHERRSSLSYISTKIRQHDFKDALSIRDCDGTQVLVLTEKINDKHYETRIYWEDGYICESFVAADKPFKSGTGEKICKTEFMEIAIPENDLVYISVGEDQYMYISLWSGVSA